jgi:hypothetical protein
MYMEAHFSFRTGPNLFRCIKLIGEFVLLHLRLIFLSMSDNILPAVTEANIVTS